MEQQCPAHKPADVIRVVIAYEYELMRVGLRYVLEAEPDLEVVGEAASGPQALDLCNWLKPDLVLLGVRMPEMNGLEVAQAIKQATPSIRIITLSTQEDLGFPEGKARPGSDKHLFKGVSRGGLLAAVRQVLRSESAGGQVDARLLRRLPTGTSGHKGLELERLTPRELDVLRLLAQGQTNLEIAHNLSLSRGTVKAYVEQIIAKLRVTSRTHAVVRAVELGLLRVGAG